MWQWLYEPSLNWQKVRVQYACNQVQRKQTAAQTQHLNLTTKILSAAIKGPRQEKQEKKKAVNKQSINTQSLFGIKISLISNAIQRIVIQLWSCLTTSNYPNIFLSKSKSKSIGKLLLRKRFNLSLWNDNQINVATICIMHVQGISTILSPLWKPRSISTLIMQTIYYNNKRQKCQETQETQTILFSTRSCHGAAHQFVYVS